MTTKIFAQFAALMACFGMISPAVAGIGVGAKPIAGAEVITDGSRKMLDEKWTYWKSPRLAATLPIKWPVVDDPVDGGHAISSLDPASGGNFGAADIVTKKAYRDFR